MTQLIQSFFTGRTPRFWLSMFLSFSLFSAANVEASSDASESATSVDDLEWGTVLFSYYQQDYFNALVDYSYNQSIENPIALRNSGKLLNGGMMLSYGLADESQRVFSDILDKSVTEEVRNRAWYYLANLFYHKDDMSGAYNALQQVNGVIPRDLHPEYQYLATLVNNQGQQLATTDQILNSLPEGSHHYPYIVFNSAIGQLNSGNVNAAMRYLEQVTGFANQNEELATLADRARHGLAQLALREGQFPAAWSYLQSIRTSGIYSNRALLTYAWSAIKLKQFNDAVPALEILNQRSIAIPEVQEAKVLLSHLYEQEGAPRKALKGNLLAIEAFEGGVQQIAEARRMINKRDVPREFVQNLELIMEDSDWYGTQPSVDYKKLTPFLIDLMASNVFMETLNELSDLYAIRENLKFWSIQAREHTLILSSTGQKTFTNDKKEVIKKSEFLKQRLAEQTEELQLHTLTMEERDQERFSALLESMSKELELLEDKVTQLKQIKGPYKQPISYQRSVAKKHQQIKEKLKTTQQYVAKLEKIMRRLINAELDKHEDRMRYYWAQSRLAKARLYDTMLMDIDKAKTVKKSDKASGGQGR